MDIDGDKIKTYWKLCFISKKNNNKNKNKFGRI